MSIITNLYKIGYTLRNVKVLFNHEITINITNINIIGKQGEILNIPRWIANILETDKHIEIQDHDLVDELKQSLVKENSQDEFNLSTLDPYFYIKIKTYLKKLLQPEHDHIESLLKSLFRKRQGKIIRLSDSSQITNEIIKKLTIEELEFYNHIYNTSIAFKTQIFDTS